MEANGLNTPTHPDTPLAMEVPGVYIHCALQPLHLQLKKLGIDDPVRAPFPSASSPPGLLSQPRTLPPFIARVTRTSRGRLFCRRQPWGPLGATHAVAWGLLGNRSGVAWERTVRRHRSHPQGPHGSVQRTATEAVADSLGRAQAARLGSNGSFMNCEPSRCTRVAWY